MGECRLRACRWQTFLNRVMKQKNVQTWPPHKTFLVLCKVRMKTDKCLQPRGNLQLSVPVFGPAQYWMRLEPHCGSVGRASNICH
jgi:hypothetical protein